MHIPIDFISEVLERFKALPIDLISEAVERFKVPEKPQIGYINPRDLQMVSIMKIVTAHGSCIPCMDQGNIFRVSVSKMI